MTRQLKGHGTIACYDRGCRCEPCRAAKRQSNDRINARRRAARAARGPLRPGSHRIIHLDEVAELIGWGVSIQEVARRLDVKLQSIERVALRRGTEQEKAVIMRALQGLGRRRGEQVAA